ncbi:unnamed protein product [Umbelopsis vinacea]
MSVEAALLWTVAEDDAPAVVTETEDDAKTLELGDEMALVGDEDKPPYYLDNMDRSIAE